MNHLTKKVTGAVAATGALIAAFGITSYAGGGVINGTFTSDHPKAAPAPLTDEEQKASDLFDAHNCWRVGDTPADMVGQYPGHVVILTKAGDAAYGAGNLIHLALEQVAPEPDHVDHGIEVIGMCR